jgi:hypothetical protein
MGVKVLKALYAPQSQQMVNYSISTDGASCEWLYPISTGQDLFFADYRQTIDNAPATTHSVIGLSP